MPKIEQFIYGQSFFSVNNFFDTMFDVEEVLCPFAYVVFSGSFFFPCDWLHFFLSIDFLIWIVLPIVFPMLLTLITLLLWFSLLAISSRDFAEGYLTLTDDSFIRLMTYCWFWQKVLCKSFSNSMIFLSLYFSYLWKFLFIVVIFSNFLWS